MKITEEITKKFGTKYDYLSVLKVDYDTLNLLCEIWFLYPEKIEEVEQSHKQELTDFLTELLDLSCSVKVKFKRSFLDVELITNGLYNYLDKIFPSVFSLFKKENISIIKDDNSINISLLMNKTILEYFESHNLKQICENFLQENFIAKFNVIAVLDTNSLIDESILDKRTDDFYANIKPAEVIERYDVFEPESIIGAIITPKPELIKNNNKEKNDVILAGVVSSLKEGTFVSRRTKKSGSNEPSYYYSFTLTDHTSKISAIYFSNKSTLKNIRKIKDGDKILVMGNIKQGQRDLCVHIKSLSLCEIIVPEIKKNEVDFELKSPTHIENYSIVTPYAYMPKEQENFFEKPKEYESEFINTNYVVFDCETTGLDCKNCDITEIGAVKVINGKIKEVFQTLIKPNSYIPKEVTELTGITNEMVENAPQGTKVIQDFYKFCEDCTLAGYNVNFDMGFIQELAKKSGLRFENKVCDVMTLAKKKLYLPRYKLINVVEHLKLKLNNAHRALFDAIATAEVFQVLSEIK